MRLATARAGSCVPRSSSSAAFAVLATPHHVWRDRSKNGEVNNDYQDEFLAIKTERASLSGPSVRVVWVAVSFLAKARDAGVHGS